MGLAKMVVTLLPGDEGYVIALAQVNKPTPLLSPTGNCSRNKNLKKMFFRMELRLNSVVSVMRNRPPCWKALTWKSCR